MKNYSNMYGTKRRGISPVLAVFLIILAGVLAGTLVFLLLGSSMRSLSVENNKLSEVNKTTSAQNTQLQKKVGDLEKENQSLKDAAEKAAQTQTDPADFGTREQVQQRADLVLHALKDRNMEKLASYVHPQKGVRFTPYGYVDLQKDLVFSASQLPGALKDPKKLTWGAYDGTGDPIKLSFKEYLDKFVYDQDFVEAPQIVFNQIIPRGNSLNNIQEAYPGAAFIEYYFPGFDPQYNGMDWRAIRLVFEKKDNVWYLTGITHDQWTI